MGLRANRHRASFGGDKNVLELVVMVAQHSEDTEKHASVQFKMVNFMLCNYISV